MNASSLIHLARTLSQIFMLTLFSQLPAYCRTCMLNPKHCNSRTKQRYSLTVAFIAVLSAYNCITSEVHAVGSAGTTPITTRSTDNVYLLDWSGATTGKPSSGTAALIKTDSRFADGRVLLTAAHNVTERIKNGTDIEYGLVNVIDAQGNRIPGFAFIHPDYDPKNPLSDDDLAVIVLDRATSGTPLEIATALPAPQRNTASGLYRENVLFSGFAPTFQPHRYQVGIAGYIGADANALSLGLAGFYTNSQMPVNALNPMYRHYVHEGDSGGPVLYNGKIIGVNRSGEIVGVSSKDVANPANIHLVYGSSFLAENAVEERAWITSGIRSGDLGFLEGTIIIDDNRNIVCVGSCNPGPFQGRYYHTDKTIFHPAIEEPSGRGRERLILGSSDIPLGNDFIFYNGTDGHFELNDGLIEIFGNAINRGSIVVDLNSSHQFPPELRVPNVGNEVEFIVHGQLVNTKGATLKLDALNNSAKFGKPSIAHFDNINNSGTMDVGGNQAVATSYRGPGLLSIAGTFTADVIHEGTISPHGKDVGQAIINGDVESKDNARLAFGITDFDVNKERWDKLTVTGSWSNSATITDPLVLAISSVDDMTGAAAPAIGFNPAVAASLNLVDISSYSGDLPVVDASQFLNPRLGGKFVVEIIGNDGILKFLPVTGFNNRTAWTNPGGGEFRTAANWLSQNGGVPGSTDTIIFDNRSIPTEVYEVQLTGSETVDALYVQSDSVSINADGNMLHITGNLQVGKEVGDEAFASLISTSPGAELKVDGELIVAGGPDRDAYDSNAMLEVGGIQVTAPTIRVGNSGQGTLLVTERGVLNTNDLLIGDSINQAEAFSGNLIVTGTDSIVNVETSTAGGPILGSLTLQGGSVERPTLLQIADGATLTNDKWFIVASGSETVADVQITDARAENRFYAAWVGSRGAGSLEVSQGGYFYSSASSSPSMTSGILGQYEEGRGTAVISGNGSHWEQDGNLSVGFRGRGDFSIFDGGRATGLGGNIGRIESASGVVTIDGAGSMWELTEDLFIGGNTTGQGGEGSLLVSSGGAVSARNIRVWETGRIQFQHGTLIVENDVINDGLIIGLGSIEGDLTNNSLVDLGDIPGTFSILGNYSDSSSGLLLMNIYGDAIDEYSQLSATDNILLSGNLYVIFNDHFAPTAGDVFELFNSSQFEIADSFELSILNLEPGFEYVLTDTGELVALTDGVFIPEPNSACILISLTVCLQSRKR